MRWRQVDDHWAVSECGYYTVTKSIGVDRHGDAFPVYFAWYRPAGTPSSKSGQMPLLIGKRKSAKGAQTVCKRHRLLSEGKRRTEERLMEQIKADADQRDMFGGEQATDSSEPQSVDTLLDKLDALGVFPGKQAADAWTEQERVVAWEWALAFEEHGEDCTIARPHWLPIPEAEAPAETAEPQSTQAAAA